MSETRGVHALVLGDGDPPGRAALDAAWPGWYDGVGLVVAADGGARLAEALGVGIDAWVGDGDSLPPATVEELARCGVSVELVDAAKDESDLELAVVRAVGLGATRITVLGALRGPRLDHELANVFLLAHPLVVDAGIPIALLDPAARVSLLSAPPPVPTEVGPGAAAAAAGVASPARRELPGRSGELVSLFPLGGDVEGVTTDGLAYPLVDETLRLGPARGLSNVRTASHAAVTIRTGRLLIVEAPATVGP